MSRASLLAELATYQPRDARERTMTDDLIAFVSAHPECFERSLAVGHVTASAWVTDPTGAAALLTHHRKLGRWLQLGGHADGDADVRRVALREAVEESGVTAIRFASPSIYDVDIHRIPARPGEPEHWHYDVRFAFFAARNAPLSVSAESHELRWIPLDRLDAFAVDESVRRLARKTPDLLVTNCP